MTAQISVRDDCFQCLRCMVNGGLPSELTILTASPGCARKRVVPSVHLTKWGESCGGVFFALVKDFSS